MNLHGVTRQKHVLRTVGDSRTYYKGLLASTMREVMACVARGMVDYCFLGGAQIDAYGNLNSTQIGGDWEHPKVRLPGSGGANDLGSHCWKILVLTPHDKRRFVEKLDFLTTPGYLTGPGARERAGLPAGSGPYKVITDLCVMDYDPDTCRMRVEALHPGVTLEQVHENTGFELAVREDLDRTKLPTEEEFRDLKNRKWELGFDESYLSEPEREDRRWCVLAIAHLFLMAYGAAAEKADLAKHFLPNTPREREISLARLGAFVIETALQPISTAIHALNDIPP